MSLVEILVILLIVLVVMGPEKLPEMARTLGKWTKQIRDMTGMLRDTMMLEENNDDFWREQHQRNQQTDRMRQSGPIDQPQEANEASAGPPETDEPIEVSGEEVETDATEAPDRTPATATAAAGAGLGAQSGGDETRPRRASGHTVARGDSQATTGGRPAVRPVLLEDAQDTDRLQATELKESRVTDHCRTVPLRRKDEGLW